MPPGMLRRATTATAALSAAATLITSEPAYLVTADGSRYFVGALLPSGHRVARINPGSVTLELHGQQTTLNF